MPQLRDLPTATQINYYSDQLRVAAQQARSHGEASGVRLTLDTQMDSVSLIFPISHLFMRERTSVRAAGGAGEELGQAVSSRSTAL